VGVLPFSRVKSIVGASTLDGQLALHLCQACHHMKEEATGGSFCVDGIGETLELNTLFL
jgi:hypothetical protein